MLLAIGFGHVGEEVERRVVVAHMLEAEMVVLALEAVTLGCLVDTRLVAAFPRTVGDLGLRLWRMRARMDPNSVEELGIDTHQS